MRGLPQPGSQLLQPDLLQRIGKERPETKRTKPRDDIYILFRDMRTYGYKEDYYREAAGKEVRFIRYEPQDIAFVAMGTSREISFIPEIAAKECWDCKECFPLCPTEALQAAFVLTKELANFDHKSV